MYSFQVKYDIIGTYQMTPITGEVSGKRLEFKGARDKDFHLKSSKKID